MGVLRGGFMEERVPAVRIIKAEKFRQALAEAHNCYKCKHIKNKKTIKWPSKLDDSASKRTSFKPPPLPSLNNRFSYGEVKEG